MLQEFVDVAAARSGEVINKSTWQDVLGVHYLDTTPSLFVTERIPTAVKDQQTKGEPQSLRVPTQHSLSIHPQSCLKGKFQGWRAEGGSRVSLLSGRTLSAFDIVWNDLLYKQLADFMRCRPTALSLS